MNTDDVLVEIKDIRGKNEQAGLYLLIAKEADRDAAQEIAGAIWRIQRALHEQGVVESVQRRYLREAHEVLGEVLARVSVNVERLNSACDHIVGAEAVADRLTMIVKKGDRS